MSDLRDALVVIAGEADAGERADVVLSRHLPQLSRRVAKRLALEGKLRIDGHKAKPSDRVHPGEELRLRLPSSDAPALELDVLRETEDFVYVHKPSGVHTVALRPDEPGCLATAVARAFPGTRDASEDPRESGAAHRLDQATSGVVAFAKTREAWRAARDLFDQRKVVKDYIARSSHAWEPKLPQGALSSWFEEFEAPEALIDLPCVDGPALRIRAPLGRGEARDQVAVRLDGQRATTLLQRTTRGRCARLRLVTGLRHQARVHMAWVGLPIDGDTRYGGLEASRLMLHAYQLDLSAGFADESPVCAPADAAFFED
jgi:23S rRNA pseudouridine1911/1915/1917 synthase